MKKRTLSRKVLTLALGMSLAAAGAFAAFADPLGLSYINGQTVTSRMGGFEFSAPAEYKVDRSGASSALSGEIVAGLVEDSGKIDFAASMVDETNKSYIINTAMVLPADDGSGQPFSVETLKAELAESGLDPADTESGTVKLGAADYEYLKVNYGKMMADSIRRQLESGGLSEKQKAQAQTFINQMEKMLVNDFYIRNTGDQIYVLCQTYSSDQAQRAAAFLGLLKSYTGVEGWYKNGENWQYKKADGQLALNCWEQDENGLTYHLDGNGNIEYNAWVQENGGWKYADESGHMVTSVTKTINGVQYTFDDKGNMIAGSEKAALDYSLGKLEGNTYTNYWADMTLSFPEEATVMIGNGSAQTYALVGGEHVDVNDPELSYRITVDFTEADMELDRFMDAVVGHGGTDGYKVDASGKVSLGGYEFRYCRTSYDFGDGTAHHSDWYVRQIDSKLVLIHFDYYDELKNQVQQVYDSIRQPQA